MSLLRCHASNGVRPLVIVTLIILSGVGPNCPSSSISRASPSPSASALRPSVPSDLGLIITFRDAAALASHISSCVFPSSCAAPPSGCHFHFSRAVIALDVAVLDRRCRRAVVILVVLAVNTSRRHRPPILVMVTALEFSLIAFSVIAVFVCTLFSLALAAVDLAP